MKELAPGVWLFTGSPLHAINVYLLGDVLIDAATRWSGPRIFGQLGSRKLSLVALTHVHPDHQGMAAAACRRFGVPLACHAGDVPVMEGKVPMGPSSRLVRLGVRLWAGPPYPVKRVLQHGDEIAGFRVLHAPGHTPGHVMFLRESDRVVIAGDVVANMSFLTGRPGLKAPPPFFCTDYRQNLRSIRLLASLRPSLVGFGHGPPLLDTDKLQRFAERLPLAT